VRFGALVALAVLIGWMTRRVRRYERRLQELANQLSARNRDLDAFAGRVAHDLKNAISPVALSLSVLRRESDPNRVHAIVERADASSRKAAHIIDALLAFSRASGSPGEDEFSEVRPVVDSILDDIIPVERDMVVDVNVPEVGVRCSPELLQVVLANIIGNAVKYLEGHREKRISISAAPDGGGCHIEVADTGPGIPQDAQTRIFEPFYRVEGTRAPGTGIGLATVRRIVEARGGRVGVESTEGVGSRFHIWLPRSLRRPEPDRAYERPSVGVPPERASPGPGEPAKDNGR